MPSQALHDFHPAVRRWFERTHGTPTPPQELGWPPIAQGRNTLILAPTGSGKTLAAFLWTVNHLVEEHLGGRTGRGVRVVYVSPLKALNNDVARNLQEPLAGIRAAARELGTDLPPLTAAVRTGDTPAAERNAMLRTPPDILITTPESLYLMLTSPRARGLFRTVRYVIVDEIHSLAGNKRGVHLSLTLERLEEIAAAEPVRIGLSATQRPLERIARFLGGLAWDGGELNPRPVTIVDAGRRKAMDLRVECAAPDLTQLPPEGIWPEILTRLLGLILSHRTTLVFVNNRRLAERIAAGVNELASGRPAAVNLHGVPVRVDGGPTSGNPPPPLVLAYHGSMSRETREQMETELKRGGIRALIATSSLELGIDIGGIDLVVQLQSPHGIARGLQRIGRSGHLVAATSKGRVYPTHADDLVEAAVVARAMAAHEVEETAVPENCLDVLAQQIVAMVSVEERTEEGLFRLVRRSACFANLSEGLFTGVLRMLAGRTDGAPLHELRPRLSRDTVNGVLRALPGSSRIALTSGGTISDRGTFGVYLEDGATRVGDVDEEFVFESRPGDTFILGSSVWRMTRIDTQRVTVKPAPGEPARMPFWRGEGIGRSPELGLLVGEFRRTVSAWMDAGDAITQMMRDYPLDTHAAWNIQEYFRRQREAAGDLPSDRLVLVEGFRDEIGDPRVVVHSPRGRRVNGLLAIVLERRLADRTGLRPQTLYNDDGVLLRSPHAEELPMDLLSGITPDEAERIVLEDLPSSPLFAGQFRQNAGRALLYPKTAPGARTPLWLQRLRAADLLAATAGTPDFPIVTETAREVLHDVLDYGAFIRFTAALAAGEVRVRTIVTETPSPFAAGLLFDFLQVYMYEPDRTPADAGARTRALSRDQLPTLAETPGAGILLRPDARAAVESRLQHTADGFRARTPEELYEILMSVGPLSAAGVRERCEGDGDRMLAVLAADGRAVQLATDDDGRWVAAEEADIHRHPEQEENARRMLTRYLRSRGPVSSREAAQHLGLDQARTATLLGGLADQDPSLRRLPGDRFAYRTILERIQNTSLGILRKEITPTSLEVFTAFQLRWQHLQAPARLEGPDAADRALEHLQGLDLPAEIWEQDILQARISGDPGARLRELTAGGTVVWTGGGGGRLRPFFRGRGAAFLPPPHEEDAPLPPAAEEVLTLLERGGAQFFQDLRANTRLALSALNSALAHLLWSGRITNDTFDELLRVGRAAGGDATGGERIEILDPYHNPRRGALVQTAKRAIRNIPGWSGRWSLVRTPGVTGPDLTREASAGMQARQLLQRYGILPREFHRREAMLPWAQIAGELRDMEVRGEIRRGYFVHGFSGMQFALPEAAEMIRSIAAAPPGSGLTLVNGLDPGHPYGPGVELPATWETRPRGVRSGSVWVVYRGGMPVLWTESSGTRVFSCADAAAADLREAMRLIIRRREAPDQPSRRHLIEHWNGVRPADSAWAGLLRELGFRGDRQQTMSRDRRV